MRQISNYSTDFLHIILSEKEPRPAQSSRLKPPPPKGGVIDVYLFSSFLFINLLIMQQTIIMSDQTQYYLELEEQYGAHNYHPVPVVLNRGKGVHVWDV